VTEQKVISYAILAIAGLITIGLFFVDFYLGAIAVVILVVLIMSYRIMGETAHYPDVVAHLEEDARGIRLTNRGTGSAQEIHVTLVPHNIEFNLPDLAADATHVFALPQMVEKVKVLLTYKNHEGTLVSRNVTLSSLEDNPDDEDLLKPAFPIFGWK
jgi:hypothetical protein